MVILRTQVTNLTNQLTVRQQENNTLTTTNQELQDEVATQETVINDLWTQLNDMRTINATLARFQPSAVTRTEKIPNPEKFSGKDHNKLRPFLTQLRLKAATYTDEQAKLHFAMNSL